MEKFCISQRFEIKYEYHEIVHQNSSITLWLLYNISYPLREDAARSILLPPTAAASAGHGHRHGRHRGRLGGRQRRQGGVKVGGEGAPPGGGGVPHVQLRDGRARRSVRVQVTSVRVLGEL